MIETVRKFSLGPFSPTGYETYESGHLSVAEPSIWNMGDQFLPLSAVG